jgi:glycosyltransferase involved in cell wall biosynthesis
MSSTPLRVLLLLRDLDIGGAQRQAILLARALACLGDDVAMATFYSGGALERDLVGANVRLIGLGKRDRFDAFGFALRFRDAVQEFRPDVVYSFLTVPNLVSHVACWTDARPLIVWGVRASVMDMTQYDWLTRLSYRAEGRLSGTADIAIANSEQAARHAMARGFPRERTRVIPNAVDADAFRPEAALRQRTRQVWSIPDDGLLIGHAARADPMKDHATFFQAMALVRNRAPRARATCLVPGAEQVRDALRARLGPVANYVDVREWEAGLAAAMNAFDVFCLSSAYGESYPNVLAEALACGVPCVATDVGDSASIIGEAGAIAPPRNPDALAEALIEVLGRLSDPSLSESARQRVKDRTPEQLARETRRVMLQAMATRR